MKDFDLHGVSANIILFTAPVLNQHKGGVSQAALLPVTPKDVARTLLCFSSVVWQGCGANPPPSNDLATRSLTLHENVRGGCSSEDPRQ